MAREFLTYIRTFNSVLSFASLGVRTEPYFQSERGQYTFYAGGEVKYFVGALAPEQGRQPKFAQIWIHDPGNW